jgi:hypothetical protein
MKTMVIYWRRFCRRNHDDDRLRAQWPNERLLRQAGDVVRRQLLQGQRDLREMLHGRRRLREVLPEVKMV